MDTDPNQRVDPSPKTTVPSESLEPEEAAMCQRLFVRLGVQQSVPELVGRYELRDRIGSGGMGTVWRAYDPRINREVAIKLITPKRGLDSEMLRKRLEREAQLLGQFQHANLVTVLDRGIHDRCVYLVMELIDGPTLRELQTAGDLSSEACLRLYAAAGRGLHAAHQRGIVHRDFKPENVFVGSDGVARVGDFGLAYAIKDATIDYSQAGGGGETDADSDANNGETEDRLTQAGQLLGTLGYMAPEQLRGEDVDARADQYAFCVALWEALSGARPYTGANASLLLDAMAGPPRGGAALDAQLRAVLRRGLAFNAQDRYPDMAVVVDELKRLLERPARRRRQRWTVFGAVSFAAVVGGAIGWSWYLDVNPTCAVADRLTELGDKTDWQVVADKTSLRTAMRLERRVDALRHDAERACRADDLARRQHIGTLATRLDSLLISVASEDPEHWEARLESFELDYVSAFSVPMTEYGYELYLSEFQPRLDARELGELVDECGEHAALEKSQPRLAPADLSAILLVCGQAQLLTGDSGLARKSFKAARTHAEAAGDKQRRLLVALWSAKTSVMREDDLKRGEVLLEEVDDLLQALRVSAFDPRRAERDELMAVLALDQEDFARAHRLQWRTIVRRALFGEAKMLVVAIVGLANHYTVAEDFEAARTTFEAARELVRSRPGASKDDENHEVAYNYALMLYNVISAAEKPSPEDMSLARELLERVILVENHDYHLAAHALLLMLESLCGTEDDIAAARARLIEIFRDSEIKSSMQHTTMAWLAVVDSYLILGNAGLAARHAYQRLPPDLQRKVAPWLRLDVDEDEGEDEDRERSATVSL